MGWPSNFYHGDTAVNYPRNTWWVAAFSGEITREPAQRWMLDRPVVLYRAQDGHVIALDDRCPHRWAPLSAGKVAEDNIECPYHGITFAPDGECVKIPSQTTIVPGCKVHAYPVIETGGFVWVWMGDFARIPEYEPPLDTDWAISSDWSVAAGTMDMEGNYMQLHDNVLDLTHFGFIHGNTLGITDWIVPPKASTDNNRVKFRREFIKRQLQPMHIGITGTELERPCDLFVTEGVWVSPAVHDAIETIEFDEPAPSGRTKFSLRVVHATTPISMDRYRYYYLFGWDVSMPAEAKAAMKAGVEAIFSEDKAMLQAIDRTLREDSRGADYPEIKLQADTPQLHARHKLKELLDRERPMTLAS